MQRQRMQQQRMKQQQRQSQIGEQLQIKTKQDTEQMHDKQQIQKQQEPEIDVAEGVTEEKKIQYKKKKQTKKWRQKQQNTRNRKWKGKGKITKSMGENKVNKIVLRNFKGQNKSEINKIKGGYEKEVKREIQVPESVEILLSLGEKFIIPYKNYELKDIIEMIRDTERIWEEKKVGEKIEKLERWKSEAIKIMTAKTDKWNEEEKTILRMITQLEIFMKENEDITIEHVDKGKKTIIMEKKEKEKMERIFMEEAQNKGLYKVEGEANKRDIKILQNREMAKIRRKVAEWKKNGIYKERNDRNMGKEQEIWN